MIGTESHPVLFFPARLIYSEAWLCADDSYEQKLTSIGAPGRAVSVWGKISPF
jgi:hypothetical protein